MIETDFSHLVPRYSKWQKKKPTIHPKESTVR